MPRTINHEALISPEIRVPTRYGNRPAFEVLVRDLTGGAPIRYARYVQVYSTDTPVAEMRARAQRSLKAAYAAERVTTVSSEPQWTRTVRFIFDEGEPDVVLHLTDLPFIEAADLAG